MAGDLARLSDGLALALAVHNDLRLRAWLRNQARAADLEPLFVRLGGQGVWARLDGGQTRLERRIPAGVPELDLFGRLEREPATRLELETAARRSGARAQANQMLESLLLRGVDPTRQRLADVLEWSALLEHDAYRFGARSTSVRVDLRGRILRQPSAPATRPHLLTYWRLALANSHLSLLAATPGARPWLVDMARSFTWVDWTPTFTYVQERSLWFAAVGAQQAVAFGAEVVESYLRTMAMATHPLRAFDATFGLTAIGLSEPRLLGDLAMELGTQSRRFARQAGSYGALQAAMVECALRCLADPDAADRAFQAVAPAITGRLARQDGLLTRPAAHLDIATAVEPAGYLGLVALPALLRRTALDLYPLRSARLPVSSLGPAGIAAHIGRTWTSGSTPQTKFH